MIDIAGNKNLTLAPVALYSMIMGKVIIEIVSDNIREIKKIGMIDKMLA